MFRFCFLCSQKDKHAIMDKRQKELKEYKSLPQGYYHLCTDGWREGELFHNEKQYAQGVTTLALSTLFCKVRMHGYELMRNHFHSVLSATGAECVRVFYYCKRRINKQLIEDGYPPLPEDYGFKLIPIPDLNSFRAHMVYLARNPYEKGLCSPCGHKWGTGYLLFNELAHMIRGIKVRDLSAREISRLTKSFKSLPPDWEIHPEWGILPRSFVSLQKVREAFPTVKDYMTALVKDYESYVRISDSLGETIEWSLTEVKEIVRREAEKQGVSLNALTKEDKCRLAVGIVERYHISALLLSQAVFVPAHVIEQSIRSKDYGMKKRGGADIYGQKCKSGGAKARLD